MNNFKFIFVMIIFIFKLIIASMLLSVEPIDMILIQTSILLFISATWIMWDCLRRFEQ